MFIFIYSTFNLFSFQKLNCTNFNVMDYYLLNIGCRYLYMLFAQYSHHHCLHLLHTIYKFTLLKHTITAPSFYIHYNASNMSDAYSDVQAWIKNMNLLAQYVPCAAHFLNPIALVTAECCHESSSFFSTLQLRYHFFTLSTHCWSFLMPCLRPRTPVVKSLSQTY